ncbi:MAG: hypothetical protein KHZ58_05960 [Hungatella hathewayi]|nr:hypothetical protein [Hungatella hathewayi]
MANYMESPDSVIQNLKDAGCDSETVAQFMELGMEGNRQNQLKLLEQHRKRLLEKVHRNEKRIDCLDYLVFQMNKEEKDK